ncbi:MAG: class E sortase [Clostridiales bacterium]|nr:class E sortase [Clostridiales bacterium]
MSVKRKILFAFFCLLVVAGGLMAFQNLWPYLSRKADPIPVASPPKEAPNEEPPPVLLIPESEAEAPASEEGPAASGLPVGSLVITKERQAYADTSLTLVIPELNLTCPVYDGTTAEILSLMGAGLYDYAQLPGEGNRNTSMAGHRNTRRNGVITDKAPFYYIDRLQEGDYLYLYNEEAVYRYLWEFCVVVEQDDWSMIRTAGYSCLTITSCHPIGISDHRIVVRGVLDGIFPYSADFAFLVNVTGTV